MKKADVKIVKAPNAVDWKALHELLHTAFAYMDERIDPPSSLHRMSVDDLRRKAVKETLYLAFSDDLLVGCMFCRVETPWLYVGKVAVDPSIQKSGLGRRFFNRAFELAARLGLKGLELETRVELIENHAVFAKLGFVKVGEDAHDGYDHPTSIRMRSMLS